MINFQYISTENNRTFGKMHLMSVSAKRSGKKTAAAKPANEARSSKNVLHHSKPLAQARFDARLSQQQKDLFEKAAAIKGFKSLSEFVIYYTSEAATYIIEIHNQILNSENDKAIFFNALINPPKPNAALKKAAKRYREKAGSK